MLPCGKCALPVNYGIWAHKDTRPSPLILAIENEHEMCLLKWIESDADVNYDKFIFKHTPLMLAVMKNLHQCAKHLLMAGCHVNDADQFGISALLYAVSTGKEDFVNILVAFGAKQFACNTNITPLQAAAYLGYNRILKTLLHAGGEVDEYNTHSETTLLMLSTGEGSEECMKELLQAGANINLRNASGATALCYAKTSTATKLLLEAGAEINIQDMDGYTPLMFASMNGHCDLLKLLLESGANSNLRNSLDNTALIIASMYGCNICIKLLIKYHADLNVKGRISSTALITAARRGHIQVVKTLLSAKAHVNMCPNDDQKALSAAIQYQNEACITLLFIAGEKLCDTESANVPAIVKSEQQTVGLKHFCRKSIRNYLISKNPTEHLFQQIPKLGLPTILAKYLLYNTSIEDA